MQRLAIFVGILCLAVAAGLSWFAANAITVYLETSTTRSIDSRLAEGQFDWVSVSADGLRVSVAGPAPDEGSRFKALLAIKSVVAESRIDDLIRVVDPDDLRPPRFSLELLRNNDGISLIGLVPGEAGREFVLTAVRGMDSASGVTDMLETADYMEPDTWNEAVSFALASLQSLPRSKISVTPEMVTITAITDSQDEKARIEAMLEGDKPEQIALVLNISAPRPVITPFSLRLIIDSTGTRFDACSADTTAARARILAAARGAGLPADVDCRIGLGAPSPRWSEAVEMAIRAMVELGGGTLTFSDADVTIVAADTTSQNEFDHIVHSLEAVLPDVFSVHAVLPPRPLVEGGKQPDSPEFLITRSPEGMIQMRGRFGDLRAKTSAANFARAMFGRDNVHDTTRVDAGMPDGWSVRVLAGIEALSLLHHGSLTLTPEVLQLRGVTDRPDASTEITQLFSDKLEGSSRYEIDVSYDEALNQVVVPPTPEECVDRVNNILREKQITFGPGSTRIEGDAFDIVQRIAGAMADCTEVPMEIGGHTDSQGREAMNLTLSQARAEAVLDTLLSLEVLTTNLTAKGYGESAPIADNGTEEGRQANRRIEFTLMGQPETAATEAADTQEETPEEANADEAASDPVPAVSEEDPEKVVADESVMGGEADGDETLPVEDPATTETDDSTEE